jgi:hypothetical protein
MGVLPVNISAKYICLINEMVYALYGLAPEEIAIVEGKG